MTYDAVIIGGGPAGAMCGALLGSYGRNVVILEKETFPRYIVGESMLPYCYYPLERVGMVDKLNAASFVKKLSVQFVGRSGNVSQPFYFHEHRDHPSSQTWQVKRSEFDEMMLKNAKEKGAKIVHATASDFITNEDNSICGVIDVQGNQYHGKITIDASGRNGFATHRLGWRIRDAHLKKMAVWRYFKGAKRDSGRDEGATTIAYLPQNGWFWYIPLPDDIVSVGIVADRSYLFRDTHDQAQIFKRELENNLWIKDHLAAATPIGKIHVTGDYSYRSKHISKDGVVLVGDAFTFLDPVFSSGIYFALISGEMVADVVHAVLGQRDNITAEDFNQYAVQFCQGVENMRKLVYAFYDEQFRFADLLKKHPHLNGDLTDCLIGHLFKDLDELFKGVSEFAEVPQPLAHGLPLSID